MPPAFVSVPASLAAEPRLEDRTCQDHPGRREHGLAQRHCDPPVLLCPQRAQAAKNFPATEPKTFPHSSDPVGAPGDRNWLGQPVRTLVPERLTAGTCRGRTALDATFVAGRTA